MRHFVEFSCFLWYNITMENIKENICRNLVLLRKSKKLTQQEFAKIFNYSDKAVSRWERGDSLPSIEVLSQICDYYGVEFEWLIHENTKIEVSNANLNIWYRIGIILLFAVSIFTLATVGFVYLQLSQGWYFYQLFVWAVPISLSIACYFTKKWNMFNCYFAFLSACMWTTLIAIFVQALPITIWPIFLIGIPLQIIFILLFLMRKIKK